jgi:ketosteroid isomerase-like protein
MAPSEAQLQEMLDEFELAKLVHRYCRAVDRGDLVQLRDLYHDDAEGEIYTIATHTVGAGDRDVDVIVGGRYLDKYEKRSGTWKFTVRQIVTDWAHVNDPSSVDLGHPITRDTPRGTPDANDPSYQFFSLLRSK